MKTPQTYSLIEISNLMNVTRQTVTNWLKAGCPSLGKVGGEWQLSLPDVIAWHEQRTVERAVQQSPGTEEEHRTRLLAAKATLAEIQVAKERGEVVNLSVVAQVVGDQLTACRSRLLAIPTKAAPLVATMNTLHECRDIIDAMIREALDELTGYPVPG